MGAHKDNKISHYAELRQQVKFKIKAVEPRQVDYLPGYYSVVSTASIRGLKGKYTVALVSEKHRAEYMAQGYFKDEMEYLIFERID